MVRTTNPGHRQRLTEALAGDRGAATLQNTIIAPVLLLVLAVFPVSYTHLRAHET